jgi:hypothetical protein
MLNKNVHSHIQPATLATEIKSTLHKPKGRGFETHDVNDFFFNLPGPFGRIRPWGSLSL